MIPELEVDGVLHRTDAEKANCFNKFFGYVFTVSDGLSPRFVSRTTAELREIIFSPRVVLSALHGLSSTYSSGVDDIPSIVLKNCKSNISGPLCRLYTSFFESSELPMDWLRANVIPIYKGSGSTKHPNNYRPVSLTVSASKVM